jgi:type I restriction-modification system DNA methylase subunit
MTTKLTLRLDEGLIRDATRAARARGVSLLEKDYVLVLLFLKYVSENMPGSPLLP